jgi:hypothetical protein
MAVYALNKRMEEIHKQGTPLEGSAENVSE